MSNFNDIYSNLGALGYQEGNTDLLAIIKDSPRQSLILETLPSIDPNHIITAGSFNFTPEQTPKTDNRYAGEGAESNTFMIPNVSIKADFTMPFLTPSIGYVDPVIALLWDYCKLAYWGTAGVAKARVISTSGNEIEISNIADFMIFNTESSTAIHKKSNGTTEDIVITEANKVTRTITLENSLSSSDGEIIAWLPRESVVEREPAFSLISLREGLISPCLVNKISMNINAGEDINIDVGISALNIDRQLQMQLRSALSTTLSQYAKFNRVSQILNGTMATISPASSSSGEFGLELPIGDCLTSGFQGLDLPLHYITGITISIENNIKEIYTSHSVKTDIKEKRRENSFPLALYCQGRTISGTIKYRHPLEPMAFAERLSGPSALAGGGIIITVDNMKIVIPEIVWSPSTSSAEITEFQERELKWTMVAQNYNDMPILDIV
jgi:hypothetical protein